MAQSVVTFRDRSALFRDFAIYRTVMLISVASAELGTPPNNIIKLLEWWRAIIDACGPGVVDLRLDEFMKTENDRLYMIKCVDHAIESLAGFGDFLPGDYANQYWKTPGVVFSDCPVDHVIRELSEFRDLL